jgi:ADP-ribose diphosphatase
MSPRKDPVYSETVFETPWFTVQKEQFPDSPECLGEAYFCITCPDAVVVLAKTDEDKWILVKQFRPALREFTLEFPAGSIDLDESPQEAAKRELLEETGYVCRSLQPMGIGRIMASRYSARAFAFFGQGSTPVEGWRGLERNELILVSTIELKKLVHKGEFQHLAGLALFVMAEWILNEAVVREN